MLNPARERSVRKGHPSRVLVSAYACNPESSARLHPGEDIKGWRLVNQIARFHNVWVITHRYNEPGIRAELKKRKLPRVRFHFVDLPRWLRLLYKVEFAQRIYYYLWQIKAWREAKRLHRIWRFDVAHHLSFGNDWMPSFIGALLPVPFIWGPLGGGQRTPPPLMREYSLYGRAAEWARAVAQFFGRSDYFRRRCLKKARAILVCNRETKEKIPKKYEDKIFWYPLNGIFSEDILNRGAFKRKGSVFRVVSAGRLHRLKGFALGIRAFARFHRKYPKSKFLMVGKGTEQKSLEKLIKNLGLEESVQISPWLSRKELLRTFCRSDVFLFPSFRDGGGAVVVEAMASGLPVICLDSGGPGFHVEPAWGVKVAPKSPGEVEEEMAEALERLYRDRKVRLRMGQEAQRRAREYYLAERLGERLQEIYLKVLGYNE